MSAVFRLLVSVYQRLFCRRWLYPWNQLLFQLSLRGLGILNFESPRLTGEREILRRLGALGGDLTVLDVGAHDGEYAAEVVRCLPGARVFAFEPHPDSFARLEAAVRGSARVTPVHAALSDRRGTATLYDHGAEVGSQHASMIPAVFSEVYRNPDVRSWAVPTLTLDEFLRERGLSRVGLLKIDTEGSELQVLRGAREAIAAGAFDLVQLEFNSMNVLSRVFMRDFRELLAGYELFRLLPDGPVLLDGRDPVFDEIFAFQNVLFVSPRLARGAREAITG